MKVTLTHEAYLAVTRAGYELKEARMIVQVAQQAEQAADRRFCDLLRTQGVEPTGTLRYSDVDLSIESLEKDPTQAE